MIKLALAMIVAPTDNESMYLESCLKNVSPHVDGIFITITGQNKKVEDVAKKYNSNISYYDWDACFGRARNFNFSTVTKDYDYILWADADDVFDNLSTLKETIEESLLDTYVLKYIYSIDENKQPLAIHPKVMVIKNDGCCEWNVNDYLHEDLKHNREITQATINNITRIHTSTPEKIESAKHRNVEIAKKHVKKEPNDPRAYFNLANSYRAVGENKKAIIFFKQYLEMSQYDGEKYVVYCRMAETYFNLGETQKAIDCFRYAIGMQPDFPDAYNDLGLLYLQNKQYEKCIEYYKMGLNRKPDYSKIIVYNPRDYDYFPMLNMAKAYYALSMPTLAYSLLTSCLKIYPEDKTLKEITDLVKKENDKFDGVAKIYEKLKNETDQQIIESELDRLSNEWKAHPMICQLRNTKLIKTTTTGRDLVYYCGHTNEVWTPQTAKEKGIGGSEEAVINLSKRLVELGWNVTVYNNCGHKPLDFDGVKYKPYWMYNYRDKQDVTILWRSPAMCDYEVNSEKIFIDLHDVILKGEFTEKRLKKIDKIYVKSKFHRTIFDNLPDNLFTIIPNGINVEEFTNEYERDPYLMINTSSPDRGLRGLVDMFAEIKKQVPQAKLKWAYGWGVFDTVHGDNLKMMEWKNKLIKDMEDLGVENLGRLSHPEVNKLYQQATVFAYPSEFAEIDCISMSKAMAGGAYPISVDFAAHGDKKGLGGTFINSPKNKDNWSQPYQYDFSISTKEQKEQYINCVIDFFKYKAKREVKAEEVREIYSWDNIANQWNHSILYGTTI